jgi:hypothetical protein
MIDVKEAVKTASAYFLDLMAANQPSDLLLEEVELAEDEKIWNVTLSALLPEPKDELASHFNSLAAALGQIPTRRRVYKLFRIDTESGKVKSMKIRPTQ